MWRIAAIALLLLLALSAPLAIRHLREAPPPPPPAVRLSLEPPSGAEFGSGSFPFDLAISPSGEELIFAATTGGESQLWRRRLDAHRAEPIANTSAATMPSFAADGRSVWYFAGTKLHSLDLTTGERREIIDAPTPGGAASSIDGTLLVASGGPIQRITGSVVSPATTLRPGERHHAFPAWIDGRRAFVYLAVFDDGRRVIRLNDNDDDIELTPADSHAIVSAGQLLFVRDGILRAEPLNLESRRLGPRAATLALDVGVSPQGRGAFAVGGRILASGPPADHQYVLRWFSDTGEPLAIVSEPGDYWQVRLSPDERTVAVTMRDPLLRTLDVFTVPSEGGAPARLTLALSADTDPVWSPDGQRVAFRSAQEGQPDIYARAVSRTGADVPIWQSPLDEVPTDWSPGHLLFHAQSPESGFDIWALPRGASTPRGLARSGFNEIDGRLSPDGRWVAYASDEGGQFDIYVARIEDPARRVRVSTAAGTRPQWIDGGRSLVFLRGGELLRSSLTFDAVSVRAATPERVLSVPGLRDAAASRKLARFLAIAPIHHVQRRNIAVVGGWRALLHSD